MARNKSDNAREQAHWLQAIGEPTRIGIVRQLATGPKNVTEIAKSLNLEIVNTSHHLGVMRETGLVTDEKDGRFVIYTLQNFQSGKGSIVLSGPGDVSVSLPA